MASATLNALATPPKRKRVTRVPTVARIAPVLTAMVVARLRKVRVAAVALVDEESARNRPLTLVVNSEMKASADPLMLVRR